MKHLLVFLLTFFSLLTFNISQSVAQSGWVMQSPIPTEYYDFFDVKFLNINTGYACGAPGVAKTTDSGVNWTTMFKADSLSLRWLSFINENTGYVSGSSHIYDGCIFKTTNGGANWTLKYFGQSYYIGAIYFSNENTGYCSNGLTILKTINGGDNWNTLNTPGQNGLIRSIYFINSMTGFAGTNGIYGSMILKTTNGGANWIETDFNDGSGCSITSISFLDSLNGYLSNGGNSVNSYVYKTSDGGISWIPIRMTGTDALPISISFANVNTGYLIAMRPILGSTKTILKTTDAAQNWNVALLSIPPDLEAVCAIDSGYAFAVGFYEKALKSTDYGNNWEYMCSTGPFTINSMYFINQLTGIAVGKGISRTTNGGTKWVPIPTPPILENQIYHSVTFINSLTGFAMINDITPAIVKTTDAGGTWNIQPGPQDTIHTRCIL